MLTNDSQYYVKPLKVEDQKDKDFCIHEGAKINTDKKEYLGEEIKNLYPYLCKWQDYCLLRDGDKTCEFKYLLLEIPPQKPAE